MRREPVVIAPPKLTPLDEIPLKSMAELELEYQNEDLDGMCAAHNDLIKDIIEKEEDLISSHRTHIDAVVDIIKQDMSLLQVVDQPNSDITSYVRELDKILVAKVEMIGQLRT